MRKIAKMKLSTTQTIILSFLAAIFIGSILLALPISSQTRRAIPYIDALFTATTAVCVTGLVTVPTFSTWSIFGQVIILILIQIGGLGVITIISGVMIGLNKRIGMESRTLIQDAFNLNTLSGIIVFIKKVIVGTFIVEGVGALLYMIVFVPEYGLRGIWISIFNSISAFCNAGIDIIAEDSLCKYVSNPIINIVTCLLIVLGGIGYIVWWDVLRVLKNKNIRKYKLFKSLTLHSKIALFITFFLILYGAVAFFIFEYNNVATMKDMTLINKIQASTFQSITTRTAGFATIPQENFTNASAIVSILLMVVGGSPAGTAGGIKTVTIIVLLASAFATLNEEDDVVIFDRRISKETIRKSVAVTTIFLLIFISATILLSLTTKASVIDIMYETVSATATVGLTRNLTSSLNIWGKIIIIINMYLGRVGPISLFIAINTKKGKKNIIKNPTEEISVG